MAALGVRVTLIDARHGLLSFIDEELSAELCHHLREARVTLRLGETVKSLEVVKTETGDRVRLHLDSGKTIITEKALYSVGRTGATSRLNLPAAGVEPDARGRLVVDKHFRTSVPHIYGVGDVIGLPALA
jgi:NAD(P) transhydrogenase